MDNIWSKIIDFFEEKSPRITAALRQANPKIKEENEILLTINADQQKNLINDNESKILVRLRKTFNNKELKFSYEIIEEVEIENRPLKPNEKYLKLRELNPSIDYFKEKFDLDFNL